MPRETASMMKVGQIPFEKCQNCPGSREILIYHDLWHAIHWDVQGVQAVQAVLGRQEIQNPLDELTDTHDDSRLKDEQDQRSVHVS